ncbi:uncharacterized protein LOC130697517 [Daphnia carinata]|uniref:uncharacterized protein LOC130697517 n=1 Tax=Daphnia carinata TaxID=120202 RepID=UPI00286856BB|nr:uncharacterized protein LOC130697517 [Daphnia carinata]
MFLNSFIILLSLMVIPQTIMGIINLDSGATTPKNGPAELARSVVQLSTTCSAVVDLQTKLILSKASSLYPELEKFLSTVAAKGKKELDRTCTNSRGDFMEYQNTEVNRQKNLAGNYQVAIEKIKL